MDKIWEKIDRDANKVIKTKGKCDTTLYHEIHKNSDCNPIWYYSPNLWVWWSWFLLCVAGFPSLNTGIFCVYTKTTAKTDLLIIEQLWSAGENYSICWPHVPTGHPSLKMNYHPSLLFIVASHQWTRFLPLRQCQGSRRSYKDPILLQLDVFVLAHFSQYKELKLP